LHITIAREGLRFDEKARPFCDHAANPSLVRLAQGDLLATFDVSPEGSDEDEMFVASSRSTDDGKTWSPWQRMVFRDGAGEIIEGRHAALLPARDGAVRIAFASTDCGDERADASASDGDWCVRTALSTDGALCRVDAVSDVLIARDEPYPALARGADGIHLFVSSRADDSEAPRSHVRHFTMENDNTWKRRARFAAIGDDVLISSAFAAGRGMGAMVVGPAGLELWASREGSRWRQIERAEFPEADSAVMLKAHDGGWLLLFSTESSADSAMSDALVRRDPGDAQRFEQACAEDLPDKASTQDEAAQDQLAAARWDLDDKGEKSAAAPTQEDEANQFDASAQESTALLNDHTANEPATVDGVNFPPLPRWPEQIDYADWIETHHAAKGPNAADAYAAFMPFASDSSSLPWPDTFTDMLNGQKPPIIGPWDAAEHADWENSWLDTQALRGLFREATHLPEYRTPFRFNPADADANAPALIGLLLPNLRTHRTMSKSTLAAAWRMEDGVVPPQQMIEALQTVAQGAQHMAQGDTLIERLVGVAENAMVNDHARRALAQGVFADEASLTAAMDMLARSDPPIRDLSGAVATEEAFLLDCVQQVFRGFDGQRPRINRKSAETIAGMASTDATRADAFSDMTRADVEETVQVADRLYRTLGAQMQAGYPTYRAADIDELCAEAAGHNSFTQMLVPALSRAHVLHARAETSRRATHLAFAINLFEKQNGRWPESLDELPAEHVADVRTDPFSGGDFQYRIDEKGPRLYSASENGVDDGGVHSKKWDDEITNDEGSDDHVFWPVQD
jgi:hypothetical protein